MRGEAVSAASAGAPCFALSTAAEWRRRGAKDDECVAGVAGDCGSVVGVAVCF